MGGYRKPATVNGFYRPMRRAIGNLQLSMVSIGLCVGLRKPATVNGFYRPMHRAKGNLQLSVVSLGLLPRAIGLCVGVQETCNCQWFL